MSLNGGFTNYPTYAIVLWLDNEEYLHSQVKELVRFSKDLYTLECYLKDFVRELVCIPTDNLIAVDLLEYCLEEINYFELAEYYSDMYSLVDDELS